MVLKLLAQKFGFASVVAPTATAQERPAPVDGRNVYDPSKDTQDIHGMVTLIPQKPKAEDPTLALR